MKIKFQSLLTVFNHLVVTGRDENAFIEGRQTANILPTWRQNGRHEGTFITLVFFNEGNFITLVDHFAFMSVTYLVCPSSTVAVGHLPVSLVGYEIRNWRTAPGRWRTGRWQTGRWQTGRWPTWQTWRQNWILVMKMPSFFITFNWFCLHDGHLLNNKQATNMMVMRAK